MSVMQRIMNIFNYIGYSAINLKEVKFFHDNGFMIYEKYNTNLGRLFFYGLF